VRDRAWVQRILRGDRAAGERLVTQNYDRVYGMLRSLTGHREVAEDLTQQTFARAWQGLDSYRGEARLSTWLCRIAYHEYTHWLRARREYVGLDAIAEVPDSGAVLSLQTVVVSRALAQLTEELRDTFLLRYERELSVEEIAVVLEVLAGTVKSRLFTARARLRELLAPAYGPQPRLDLPIAAPKPAGSEIP
jgi:RNA polymerase sigma-70 factor (ECF subfamily)